MNRPNFDEWHRDTDERPLEDGEVPATEHDLWGMQTETRASTRAPRRRDWLAPALVICAAALAFLIAWFMTHRSSNDDASSVTSPSAQVTSAPSSASTGPDPVSSSPTSSSSAASAPRASSTGTSSTASPNASGAAADAASPTSPASSVAPTSSTRAAFPDGSVTTCSGGGGVTSDVRLAADSRTSCDYVANTVAAVRAYLAADAKASTFTVTPYSEALKRDVPLTCRRDSGLSECTGGTNVHLWVRDAG